jgi:hypothetical protein
MFVQLGSVLSRTVMLWWAKGLSENRLIQSNEPSNISPAADLRDTKSSIRVEYNSEISHEDLRDGGPCVERHQDLSE